MADMFGAPLGIGAAERDQREVVQGGLSALKTMGEIEAQPTDLALKKAHARYYDAGALKVEKEAAEMEAFAGIAKGIGASGGTPGDPAERLGQIADRAINAGFVTRGAALAKTAQDLRTKEAVTLATQASEGLRRVREAAARAQMVSGIASGALQANSQEGYDMARMQAIQAGLPATQLPESYEEAKPLLQQLVTQGLKATDLARVKEAELTGRARRGLMGVQSRAAAARVDLLNARKELAKRDLDEQTKNGGKHSASVKEAREALTRLRQEKVSALDRKEFPPIVPEADWAANIGKSFTWPGGKKVRIEKNPTTGKPEAVLLEVPTRPSVATESASDDSEEDDDLED